MEWERRGFLRLSEGPEGGGSGRGESGGEGNSTKDGCGFTRGILALCHATMGQKIVKNGSLPLLFGLALILKLHVQYAYSFVCLW